jgi:hypothetical protein
MQIHKNAVLLYLIVTFSPVFMNLESLKSSAPGAVCQSGDNKNYVILPIDFIGKRVFGSSAKPAVLTKAEIEKIDEFVTAAVSKWNSERTPESPYRNQIDLLKYGRQYVPYINSKGQKEVWVNCFCDHWQHDEAWKKNIVWVMDGGSCYFSLKINFAENRYYHFSVNSQA